MAAASDVPVAHITNDGGTGELGDPGRLSELQSPSSNIALDPVVDGLAVRAHSGDRAVMLDEALSHRGEELAYFYV